MSLTPEEKDEIRILVRMSTEQAINDTFHAMGINTADFDHLEEFRDNYRWVSKYRRTAEKIGSTTLISITTILTGGVLAAIWAYVTKR